MKRFISTIIACLLLASTAAGQHTESPIAHLSRADGTFYVGAGSGKIVAETGSTALASLGLSANGRSLVTAENYAAMRVLLSVPTTYYIDATAGSDDATGISSDAAWKTIAKVNATAFLPGDTVLFKRGETWRETLLIPSSGTSEWPITYGAYGSGAKPIISGADVFDNANFAAYTTATTTWSQAATTQWTDEVIRNYRDVIPASAITTSGSAVKLRFTASSTTAAKIDGCGIGVRDGSTEDISGAVTRITFNGGSSTATIPAGESLDSDTITFSLDETKDHIVSLYTTYRAFAIYSGGSGNGYVSTSASDESQTASVSGYSGQTVTLCRQIQVVPVNTYVADSTPITDSGNGAVWEDDIRLTPQTSIAAVESAAGSAWVDYSNNKIYVHASDSSNVVSNGKVYEIVGRTETVIFAASRAGTGRDYVTVQDIESCKTNGNGNVMGGIVVKGNNNIVRRVTSFSHGRHHTSFYLSAVNCLIDDCTFDDGWESSRVVMYGTSGCNTNTLRNCIFTGDSQGSSGTGVVFSHASGSGAPYGFTIEGCSFSDVSAESCIYVHTGNEHVITGLVIRGCQFSDYADEAIHVEDATGSSITGNTIHCEGEDGITLDSSATGTEIVGNLITSSIHINVSADSQTGLDCAANVYAGSSATPFVLDDTSYSFAGWKTATSVDATSLAVQPYDADLTALAAISGVNGDLIIRSSDVWTRLAKGTENQVLKMGAALPAWGTDTDTDTLGSIGSVANGDIAIYNSGWTRLGKGDDGQVLKLASGLPAWAADTDTNTTYSAGDGLDLTGTTFSTDLKSGGGLEIDTGQLRLSTAEAAATQAGSGATATLDFSANAIIKFTFDNNGGATTFSFTDPPAGSRCLLILIQDATNGGETVVWPAAKTIYWPDGTAFQPEGTTSARSVVTLVFDGTDYYCTGYDYATP